jgi:hypothetical protein
VYGLLFGLVRQTLVQGSHASAQYVAHKPKRWLIAMLLTRLIAPTMDKMAHKMICSLRYIGQQFLEAVSKAFSLVCLAIFESSKLPLLRTFGKNGQNGVVKGF